MMMRFGCCVLLIVTGISVLAGCESTPSTSSLDQALHHYDAQRFSLAREQALRLRNTTDSELRGQAAYLAGLSAYRLGEHADARTDLLTAAASSDAAISGLANAQLGLIELDSRHPASAARYFETAALRLTGPAATQAAQHAAMAHQMAGDFDAAQQWVLRGSSPATNSASAGSRAAAMIARFALQAGAFESRARAEQTAREIEPLASSHRLGPVRIVQGPTARGAALHLVQFGAFDDRAEAIRARSSLGRLEVIVVPTR